MPAKLKRLLAHAAAVGRKPFDPGRVRRQQQMLLYGGGCAITAFIVVCAALVVRLDVQDSLERARSTFLQREAEFYANLQTLDRMLAMLGNRTEELWRKGAPPPQDALRAFAADHGRLAASNAGGGTPFFAMAEVTPARPAESYARYLGAALGQVDRGARYPPVPMRAEPIGGYLIALDGPFLGVLGPGVVARARALPPDTDLRALIDRSSPCRP